MLVDVRDREVVIDGKVLSFPASYEELKEILGEASRIIPQENHCSQYVYDELGILVDGDSITRMKKQKSFVDMEYLITAIKLIMNKEDLFHSDPVPENMFDGTVTVFSKSIDGLRKYSGYERHLYKNEAGDYEWTAIKTYISGKDEIDNTVNGKLNRSFTINFDPEKPKSEENYNLTKVEEPVLSFHDFNFKLAVIQELMYDQEVIKPYFDIYDYLEFKKSRANTETEKNIRAAVKFFEEYEIPQRFAEKIEEITMDGGNEIYMNIAPLWDGEDDRFDLKKLNADDVKQFPNLKKMTVLTSNIEKLKEEGKMLGIEVQQR